MSRIVEHATEDGFWRHEPPRWGRCWVCGEETVWVFLDVAHQHPDCDKSPSPDGETVIIRGRPVRPSES